MFLHISPLYASWPSPQSSYSYLFLSPLLPDRFLQVPISLNLLPGSFSLSPLLRPVRHVPTNFSSILCFLAPSSKNSYSYPLLALFPSYPSNISIQTYHSWLAILPHSNLSADSEITLPNTSGFPLVSHMEQG
jgi:hypothetical protein